MQINLANIKNDDFSVDELIASFFKPLEKALNTTNVEANIIRNSLGDIKTLVIRLKRRQDSLQRQLHAYIAKAEENFDQFLDSLLDSIDSNDKAFNATTFYNKEWFKGLPFSINSKILIAKRLTEICQQYNESYVNQLWINTILADPDAIESILYQLKSPIIEVSE